MTQFPQPGNDPCPGVPDTGHLYDLTKHFHPTLCLLKAHEVLEKKRKEKKKSEATITFHSLTLNELTGVSVPVVHLLCSKVLFPLIYTWNVYFLMTAFYCGGLFLRLP